MHPLSLSSIIIIIQSILIRLTSSSWTPLTNILSIQLRSLAYLYLRWFPSSHLTFAIPSIFFVYALVYYRNQSLNQESKIEPIDLILSDQDSNINSFTKTTSSSSETKSDQIIKKNQSIQLQTSQDHAHQNLPSEKQPLLSSINASENDKQIIHPPRIKTKYQSPKQEINEPNIIQSFLNLIIGTTARRNKNTKANKLSLLINLIITILSLDATFRTVIFHGEEDLSFSRIGAVGETWVKVHVRIPPPNIVNQEQQPFDDFVHQTAGAQLVYRPMKPIGNWLIGPSLITSNSTDWTTVGKIDNLSAGQTYEYRLNQLHDFDQPHELFQTVGHFKTAPDTTLLSNPKANGGSFTFAYSSCIKPGFPYNPIRDPLHNDGADQLSDIVKQLKLDFVLVLGDFIYADVPIYMGNSIQNYWKKYRQSFASHGWKKVMQFTRTIHIYDDHEILNDWAGNGNDTNEIFEPANKAYTDYLGSGNYEGPGSGKNYYWFRYGDAGFFVWDCRRYRSPNDKLDDQSKTMLGIEQKNTFISWLSTVNTTVTFKFVVSSTPFMSLWSGPDGGVDTWAGFLTERNELMDYMETVPNLIVLSGDRHEFAAASIRDSVIEFSTSPLNQFWLPIRTLSTENGLGKTGEDKLLKYIPNGIHKFSTLNVDCRDPMKPTVYFKLYIDGKFHWELKYAGVPVKEEPKQLGQILPSWEQLLNFLKPIKWFSNNLSNSLFHEDHDQNRDQDRDSNQDQEQDLNHSDSTHHLGSVDDQLLL